MADPNVGQPDEQSARRVRAAMHGDRRAMREIFETYRPVAFRVARRLTSHEQDALDIVQEAFVKALRGLGGLQDPGSFKTWLLRIVHNQALDTLRRRNIRRAGSLDAGDMTAGESLVDARAVAPPKNVSDVETSQRLQQALDTLSPNHRAVFTLYAQGAFTYAEIAEIVGVPVGTVMSRLYHARRQLQGQLADLDRSATHPNG